MRIAASGQPGRLAQSISAQGCQFHVGLVTQGAEVLSPGLALLVWHLDMRSSLRPFAPLPLIHVGQLSVTVTGTSKGTRYWLFPGKEWLG